MSIEMLSKNFSRDEWKCKHCDKCNVHPVLIELVQEIRDRLERPLFISSGYRCSAHPVEAMKEKGPGEHTTGMAVDIIAYGQTALFIIAMAQQLGCRRIGLHQRGRVSGRFIHLGIADKTMAEYPVALWTY